MKEFIDIPVPSRFRLGELFKDNNFEVPLYQRNFAWTSNEVDDFWNDLVDIVNGERGSHFFGQLVTFKNENQIQEIIDGQQRLTTSSLFLAAMRDTATDMLEKNRDHLGNGNSDTLRDVKYNVKKCLRGENGDHPSLMLQETGEDKTTSLRQFFTQLIHEGHQDAVNEPEKNLVRAYRMLRQKINDQLKEANTMTERVTILQTIFDCFTERFYIVMISAPSQNDAFIIFETLNSRGKDLKASDIIKNHLMYISGDTMKEANKAWQEVSVKLKDDSNKITKFIRTYWAGRKKLVTEANLYRSLSQHLRSNHDASHFLAELGELVGLYDVLESPLSPKGNLSYFDNPLLLERIDILNRLHVKLYYPVMLSLKITGFGEDDMLKVVNKLLSVFIRHRTIINDGTNTLESGFSNLAQRIYSNELGSVQDIISWLDDKLLRTDAEVQTSFQTLKKDGGLRGAKKWTLVYLLSELYEEDLHDKAFDKDNYQLVHISEDVSLPSEYQDYIGNWTLLEKGLKSQFDKAKSVTERQTVLLKSGLLENSNLVDKLSEWNGFSVKKRQSKLGENVTLVW